MQLSLAHSKINQIFRWNYPWGFWLDLWYIKNFNNYFLIRWVSLYVVVFQSVSTENAYLAQMNVAICTIYSLFLEYFKVWIKNSGDFSHSKINQIAYFLDDNVRNHLNFLSKLWNIQENVKRLYIWQDSSVLSRHFLY